MAERLRVEVPDALRGSVLAHRLPASELIRTPADGWAVIGSANGDLPQALAAIQQWLQDEEIEQTVVHLGDRPHTMTRD